MQPLLALAIAGASQDNRHPAFRLASKNPTVLSFIAKLKSWRDPVAHGHGDELDYREIMQVTSYRCLKCETVYRVSEKPIECSNCSSEELIADTTLLDDYKNQTYNIIKSLFPSLVPIGNTVNNTENTIIEDIDQLILKADIALDEFFGMNAMRLMPSNLREQLKNIELQINEEGGSSGVINSLSSVLGISLFDAISTHKSGNEITEQPKNVALNKAIESNFELVGQALPKCLDTVQKDRERQAINGISATLGANCLALLIVMPTDVLNKISGYKPNLLIFISEIINLRGHGNNVQQQISKNELLELKTQSYQIIKLLMDLNNG
jgi:DNA-directed RNA polymerase subunit RPC12/RpoP